MPNTTLMVKRKAKHGRKETQRIFAIQLLITLFAVTVSLIFIDGRAAYSAGVGGGINIITTAYFASKVFSAGPGSSAAQIARKLFVGEIVKIGLTVILFVIALTWLNVAFLPLFLTYMVTLLAYWLVLPFY